MFTSSEKQWLAVYKVAPVSKYHWVSVQTIQPFEVIFVQGYYDIRVVGIVRPVTLEQFLNRSCIMLLIIFQSLKYPRNDLWKLIR